MHRSNLLPTVTLLSGLLLTGLVLTTATALADDPASASRPAYDGDHLRVPADYREWIYLTSGFDMSYRAGAEPSHHMFDNVFVDAESYRAFVKTGTWPEKTMLVLESRGAGSQASINKAGHFQDGDVMGVEIHVKDRARFPDGWAFFAADGGEKTAGLIPRSENCYSCHASHAAVDMTFVQFYPTLLPIATAKRTLSEAYRKESGAR
jgi:hypothetical protein